MRARDRPVVNTGIIHAPGGAVTGTRARRRESGRRRAPHIIRTMPPLRRRGPSLKFKPRLV
jgi:hypothetical protein